MSKGENFAAGRWLRASAPAMPMRRFLAGAIGIAAGLVLHFVKIGARFNPIRRPAREDSLGLPA